MTWAVVCSKVMALLLMIHCVMNTSNILTVIGMEIVESDVESKRTENKSDITLSSADQQLYDSCSI